MNLFLSLITGGHIGSQFSLFMVYDQDEIEDLTPLQSKALKDVTKNLTARTTDEETRDQAKRQRGEPL